MFLIKTSCARGDTIICSLPSPLPVGAKVRRAPPSRCNVSVLSHAEYVPSLTDAAALCAKAAYDLWPWKWCPSHVWCRLPLCHFLVFLGLSVFDLGPMYASDRHQTNAYRLMPHLLGAGIITCYVSYYCAFAEIHSSALAPCGLRCFKNRPTPFPGRMSYKATKPGLVYHIMLYYCIVVY